MLPAEITWLLCRRGVFCVLTGCCLLLGSNFEAPADAAAEPPTEQVEGGQEVDLTSVPLEDLMHLKVTSVSRKEENLANSAAAVFVITQEDIRHSGSTNIPDLLRMVPGLDVARIDANKWAVSSRGFNDRFARYMLVLIDGRSVYTPLFSGVFWDAQDTLMEDIERIEVIRGPGATMWGANAVNGIINIITKNAADTTGGLVTAGGGTEERGFGSLRYGSDLGGESSMRAYAKYFDRTGLDALQTGNQGHNGWQSFRGGFRLDSEPSSSDALTLQGDYYDEWMQETYTNIPPNDSSFNYITPASGGNLLGRWRRTFSPTADVALQFSFDHSEVRYAVLEEQRNTFDLDFQNRFRLGNSQEIIWGAGYRVTHDNLGFPAVILSLTPPSQTDNLYSVFLQDNVQLVPDRLHLIIGSKFEHNDYTGFEIQPNARLLWTPTLKQSLWLSVSRAVRTPSRGEESLSYTLTGPPQTISPQLPPVPTLLQLTGSNSLKAEELLAYELGYRYEPTQAVSFDLAVFYNIYHRLIGQRFGQPVPDANLPPQSLTIPVTLDNTSSASTYGAELAMDIRLAPWWRTKTASTFFMVNRIESAPGSSLTTGQDPENQLSLRSLMNVTTAVDFDLWLRYVDRLRTLGVSDYVTLDARLAWRPMQDVELALVGQNLLHDQQLEFVSQPTISTQATTVGRGVYGKITWKF